jgi:hypothetical protein
MWGNIKGASNLEVEVDENEEALNLQFHELDLKELKNVKVGWLKVNSTFGKVGGQCF